MAPILLDSYSETNGSSTLYLNNLYSGVSQSFACGGVYAITSAKFELAKVSSPTGNAYAKLYAHSGVFGTSSEPGALLATSDAVDVSTLGVAALVEFTFSGSEQYVMGVDNYVIAIEYANGDASNRVSTRVDSTAPTAAGNGALLTTASGWAAQSWDLPFYVYGDVPSTGNNMMLLGIG